jgi:hypothetical protein
MRRAAAPHRILKRVSGFSRFAIPHGLQELRIGMIVGWGAHAQEHQRTTAGILDAVRRSRCDAHRIADGNVEVVVAQGHAAGPRGDVVQLLGYLVAVQFGASAWRNGGFCEALAR